MQALCDIFNSKTKSVKLRGFLVVFYNKKVAKPLNFELSLFL